MTNLANRKFTLTGKAKDDLKSIASYTQRKWGKEQRGIYLKQIDLAFHMLAENTEAGTACDYIKIGYRKFPNGSHIIFYRELSDDSIEIVRILHKRMDVKKWLSRP